MIKEYWLQKKTIGGWSHVTWYNNLEQAKINFAACSKGNIGYSWRLVEVCTVEVSMLNEVVEVLPPEPEPSVVKPIQSGWGDVKVDVVKTHKLAGKVWMFNRATDIRLRVDPLAVPSYETQGFVRGGPRSK